mgnify:CR=1 FL=1
MYGSAQDAIGYGLKKTGNSNVFATDKVWVADGDDGPEQIAESRAKWGIKRFDLLQVHNLLAWEAHLDTLYAMKNAGAIRYVGITTSHGRRHEDLEMIMRKHALDFVQLTYNVADREVEDRLLPLAQEKGIAVIANRPFRQKALIRRFAGKKLPVWADEIEAKSWAQFMIKYVASHPAVTVVTPATSKSRNMADNMGAAVGRLAGVDADVHALHMTNWEDDDAYCTAAADLQDQVTGLEFGADGRRPRRNRHSRPANMRAR